MDLNPSVRKRPPSFFWVSLKNQRTSWPIHWWCCKQTERCETTLLQITALWKGGCLAKGKIQKGYCCLPNLKENLIQPKRELSKLKRTRKKKKGMIRKRRKMKENTMKMRKLVLVQFSCL
jgi:hypothetical protein